MAGKVDSDKHWTIGSPKIRRGIIRVAFALTLLWVGRIIGVAVDFLYLPSLFGSVITARAGLLYLAWFCTIVSVLMGALLVGLQWTKFHSSSGGVK